MNCLTNAWDKHEAELRGWLRKQTGNAHDAEDLLQDVFLKALRQHSRGLVMTQAEGFGIFFDLELQGDAQFNRRTAQAFLQSEQRFAHANDSQLQAGGIGL